MVNPFRRTPRATGALAGAGAGALVLATVGLPVPCPFHLITGLDCPFCGGSRALGDLLRGDLAAAAGHNAYALAVLLPVAAAVAVGVHRQELGSAERWWPAGRLGRACSLVLVTATAAWFAVRNLPGFEVLRA